MVDRFERTTNLVALLLDTPRPLTLVEIVEAVPGYPEASDARRRQFERDKELLRSIGAPIKAVSPGGVFGLEETGYTIDPNEYYMPNIDLNQDELTAIRTAAALVEMKDDPTGALRKLGDARVVEGGASISIASTGLLSEFIQAAEGCYQVSASYGGNERILHPYEVLSKNGVWYLIAFEPSADKVKTFRIDRFDGSVQPTRTNFKKPTEASFANLVPLSTLEIGDEEVEITVALSPKVASALAPQFLKPAETRPDGWLQGSLLCASSAAALSLVASFLDEAELVGPEAIRTEMITKLTRCVK